MQSSRYLTKVLAILIATSLSISSGVALAEDGTSGLPPDAILSCQIVAAEWTGESNATPAASPAATPISSESTPMASPVAGESIDPLTADLIDASGAILDCMSENNSEVLTAITGPEFRGTWLGFGGNVSDDDLATLLQMMPRLPYALVGLDNATVDGETATATVIYKVGNQLLGSDWTFTMKDVNGTKVWVVQSETLKTATAPAGAVTVDVTIAEGAYTFSSTTIQGTDAVLNVTNSADTPHEVLIMRVPEGIDAEAIAKAPNGIPEGGTFVAQATVSAGATGTVILTDLEPGTYTVVDLLPDADGIPNVSKGMITTFEVTAP